MAWTTWVVTSTSGLENLPQDVYEQRCEGRQGVADECRLDGILGLLQSSWIPVGRQVAKATQGQEEGRQRDQEAGDPGANAVDDARQVTGRVGRIRGRNGHAQGVDAGDREREEEPCGLHNLFLRTEHSGFRGSERPNSVRSESEPFTRQPGRARSGRSSPF